MNRRSFLKLLAVATVTLAVGKMGDEQADEADPSP